MDNNDYLQHYGVIGMKWGVHRARVNAKKAKRAKFLGNSDKAAQYQAKSKRLMTKHQRLAGGKKAFDRLDEQGMAKTLVQSYLMTTYGALKYNEVRSKGYSRGKSAAVGVLSGWGNLALTGGVASIIEPRINKKAVGNAAKVATKSAAKRYANVDLDVDAKIAQAKRGVKKYTYIRKDY